MWRTGNMCTMYIGMKLHINSSPLGVNTGSWSMISRHHALTDR